MKYIKLNLIVALLAFNSCSDDKNSDMISGEGIFMTQSGEASIEGELSLPDGDGPFPVLIIVPGSGNTTRDDSEPFVKQINAFGYAVYSYDKRGIGGSTGSYPIETESNPFDFLSARGEDLVGIIDLLKKNIDIDDNKIGLFGSSQGTWVNCIIYNQVMNDLSLILMASGGATSTGVERYYEELLEALDISIEEANEMLFDFDDDLGFDPAPILEGINIPVLFIFGGKDDSHPTLYDKEILENMQKSNFTIQFYPNANHDLIDVDSSQFPTDLFANVNMWLNGNK